MKKSYVLDVDMQKCFTDNVLLTLKAPPGTRLEVPVVSNVSSATQILTVVLFIRFI